MSFVETLAKVAIGVAIAKGVSHVARNGLPGMVEGGTATAGRGTPYGREASAPGGLGGIMDEVLKGSGGTPRRTAPQPGGGAAPGGLGGILDGLSNAPKSTKNTRRTSAPTGFDDLLGSLTGGKQASTGGGGGLGDLLGGILGGAAAGGGIGGLGSILDEAVSGKKPARAPSRDEELAAVLMLKAMIQAAKSDGKLDQAEKQKLMDNLGDASRAEIDMVNRLLADPVDVEGLVRQVPQGMEGQVYLMSLMAIDLDSRNEAQYLHGLAQSLGLEPAEVNDIHDRAGAPRMYS